MSTYQYQKPGLGHVPSYQTSGIPFCTVGTAPAVGTTTTVVDFPHVTKFIVVRNTGNDPLRVGFSLNGVVNTGNYFLLGKSESFAADLRVSAIHLMSDNLTTATTFSIIAGLTSIDRNELINNWSGSAGVG